MVIIMKKAISVLTAGLLAVTLCACSNGGNSASDGTSAPASTSNGNTAPESTSATESAIDSRPALDISDTTGYEYPDNRAGDIMMEILNTGEWSMMELQHNGTETDAETLGWLYPNLDVSVFEEYCLASTAMSANLYKVVVAKPADGKTAEAQKSVDAYYDYIKNDPNALAYPSFEESVAGTVKGQTDDGYLYVIVNTDGAKIQDAVK